MENSEFALEEVKRLFDSEEPKYDKKGKCLNEYIACKEYVMRNSYI